MAKSRHLCPLKSSHRKMGCVAQSSEPRCVAAQHGPCFLWLHAVHFLDGWMDVFLLLTSLAFANSNDRSLFIFDLPGFKTCSHPIHYLLQYLLHVHVEVIQPVEVLFWRIRLHPAFILKLPPQSWETQISLKIKQFSIRFRSVREVSMKLAQVYRCKFS